MDELQISGRRFISARRIARENGYTSDYIGQLIRGGKIVGQKVGRAWYVDAASFDRYLGSEEVERPAAAPAAARTERPEEIASVKEPASFEKTEAPAEENAPRTTEPEVETVQKETEAVAPEAGVPESTTAAVLQEIADEVVEVVEEKITEPASVVVEPPVVQRIPLRIVKKEEPPTPTESRAGLRYYADDAPALPEIVRQDKESRMSGGNDGSVHVVEKNTSASARRGRVSASTTGLVVAGAAIFIFVAVVSSAVSLNLSIQEGNAAAASYGLEW